MEHTMKPPFPIFTDSETIVDEFCMCGARRSMHEDTTFEYGHGGCPATGCPKFTWTKFDSKYL